MMALGQDAQFAANNTTVLSVVVDSKEQWTKAINDFPELKQALAVFDTDKRVSGDYNMLTVKSSMHQGSTPGHTYVIIDKNSTVRFIYDDIRMGKNADMLISEIKKINN